MYDRNYLKFSGRKFRCACKKKQKLKRFEEFALLGLFAKTIAAALAQMFEIFSVELCEEPWNGRNDQRIEPGRPWMRNPFDNQFPD
jgi:hypothetical protein